MDKDLLNKIEKCSSKFEIAKLLGYKYINGHVGKIINDIIIKYKLILPNLGTRPSTRKYKKIFKICPVCNKKFETYLNHLNERALKTTCSHQCSNIFFAKKRANLSNGIITRSCNVCGIQLNVHKKTGKKRPVYCKKCRNERLLNDLICQKCGNEFKSINKKQRFCSRSCSSSYSVNKAIKEGIHVGWKERYKLKPSYPESYFIKLLTKEKIKFEREFKCGKYFIDFKIIDSNIALEIDGKQHNLKERKIKDKEKDSFLKQNGYRVFRIKWFNPINEKNKNKLYNQIENFKKIL